MSEAGEIPAAKEASVSVATATANEDEKQQDDGDAMVVAAAVVDDNDDEDGSTGSGSVLVAAIVDDEEPPTPNTAKIEAVMAKKLPPTVSSVSTTSAPPLAEKEETDITPVKKNITLPKIGEDKMDTTGDKPAKEEVKIALASSEKKTETPKDSEMVPIKSPTEKKVLSPPKDATDKPVVVKEKEEATEMKVEAKPEEKPPAEVVATKDKEADVKAEPMEVEPPTVAATTPKEDDAEAEEGEVEEGEVEEGEIEDVAPPEEAKIKAPPPPAPVVETKQPTEKQAPQDEEQTKMEVEVKEPEKEVKPSEEKAATVVEEKVAVVEDKPIQKEPEPKEAAAPTPMEVEETKQPEEKPKEASPKANPPPPPPPATKVAEKGDDEDDEDGEIKEDTDEEGEIKESTEEEGEIKDDTEEEGEVKEEEGEVKEEVVVKKKSPLKEDVVPVKKSPVKEDVVPVKKSPVKEKSPLKEVVAKADVEMEDAQSQSEEGGDHDRDAEMASADADTASNDGDTVSLVDESISRKVEPTSYSTRGRASGSNTPVPRGSEATAKGSHASASGSTASGAKSDQWERSVREALEDLGRGSKDPPPTGVGAGGASFLEALGEEERRTRTRFLPAVDGIHMLRKNEVKGDLALARSIMSSAGNVASVASVAGGASTSAAVTKKSKKKKHHDAGGGDSEAMDTDDASVLSSAEDAPSSDLSARIGSASTIEVDPGAVLMVPSAAFVPPPAATHVVTPPDSNGEKNEDGTPIPVVPTGVKGILNNQRNIKSPSVVESVTAFNPPRPPESVGKKKQHRMLRWERRPADVEVDLNNYRKTVDRTRKELHTAEDELERIEATSNHLRRHFLGHLQCMDQEGDEILSEFNSVQQKCVKASDLLTSRTRSRGAGKGSHVMRDVLTVLKARGAELSEKGIEIRASNKGPKDAPTSVVGTGGVGGSGFADWNQHSIITPQRLASAWVLPGDKVVTPYGEGVVVKIYPNAAPNKTEASLEATLTKVSSNGQSPTKMDIDTPSEKAASPKSGDKKPSKGSKKNNTSGPSSEELSSYLGTRIGVQLPYGVGYFSPAVVSSTETPSSLSDAQLAKRWGGIIESALTHAGKLDLNGMALPDVAKKQPAGELGGAASNAADSEGDAPMDIDGTANGDASTDPNADESAESMQPCAEKKLLPFASRLLATGTGRGNALCEMNAQKLQKALKPALTDGEGVLGDKANEGVPAIVKQFEEERQESYILQAKVQHLRNQLYRQRRIRTLNERTFAATRDRSTRVESLVAEMRTDLKSLRNRLDEELVELGVDQDRAEAILKSYYLSQDYDEHLEADEEDLETSPAPKRTREDAGDTELGIQPGESETANGDQAEGEIERQAKRAKVTVQ